MINLYLAVTLTLHLPGCRAFLQCCQQQLITMAMSCGANCAKFMLFVFNFIFFVSIHCSYISFVKIHRLYPDAHVYTDMILLHGCNTVLENIFIRDTHTCTQTHRHTHTHMHTHAHHPYVSPMHVSTHIIYSSVILLTITIWLTFS